MAHHLEELGERRPAVFWLGMQSAHHQLGPTSHGTGTGTVGMGPEPHNKPDLVASQHPGPAASRHRRGLGNPPGQHRLGRHLPTHAPA